MAARGSPATPAARLNVSTPLTPTGTWRHPRLDEISRRQNATTFSDRNVKIIMWNGGSLFGTWLVVWVVRSLFPQVYDLAHPLSYYTYYPLWALRLLLVFNMSFALQPLVRRKDDLSDIPLTPSQRALLGLEPDVVTPATPAAQYITPPRYPRSSTPRSGTPGSHASSYSNSPLSQQDTPSRGRTQGSPFSPAASPMLQKAFGGNSKDLIRRDSFRTSSPLGVGANGSNSSLVGIPPTSTPSSGKGPSLGLNSRWLYERGRGSPASGKVYL